MQRGTLGYNILTLLSMVDGKSNSDEDLVIKDWLVKEFQFSKNLDDELAYITLLSKNDYSSFLQEQMDLFYQKSNEKNRTNLLQFAMHLIKADGKIVKGENVLFDQLFDGWTEQE
jgi:uncharacterized tellurite resistance protein B-like protein